MSAVLNVKIPVNGYVYWRCVVKKAWLNLTSVVVTLSLAGLAYSQCQILPGESVTVTTAEICTRPMFISGTLTIESTGSVIAPDDSILDGTGATITVNGGSYHCMGRFNQGKGTEAFIIVNGGTFTVDGTWKLPDTQGNEHRMWINDGVVHSDDIELRGDRNAIIYVGGGILRLNSITPGSQYWDPAIWVSNGWLQPAEGYDEIVIEQKATYTEITAVSASPRVQFESWISEGLEEVNLVTLGVLLSQQAPASGVTVDYAVTGGTAVNGEDYNLSDGTVTFEPGEKGPKYVNIEIVDDGVDEDNETIVVELSNPTGTGASLGPRAQHTYTILDPRPSVGFSKPASSGGEGQSPAVVEVRLSQPLTETVTVDYAVAGGSATGGKDYRFLPGTLTFSPGVVTQNLRISIMDDRDLEQAETIVLELSNPTGPDLHLGEYAEHTFTIIENEPGILWEDKVWYYSETTSMIFINEDGDLEWTPEKGGQFITRIPEQRLSQPGDVVEISYIWMTDGAHACSDCFSCDLWCFENDIRCVDGTSDMRVGLFEADGEYISRDGLGIDTDVFKGYKGYNFRFGPNMIEGPNRFVDCHDEVHKTGNFGKKPSGSGTLMKINEGLMDYIDGFLLTPGEYSLFTVRLERTSSECVKLSITLNGRTQSDTDCGGSQPQKIDVFGIYMRNGRPYTRLVLRSLNPQGCPCPADINEDGQVDLDDLQAVAGILLDAGRPFVVPADPGDCADINEDAQVDLDDLQAVAGILLDASNPFIVPCK